MGTTYITFGQDHMHRVHGKTFDCDCVATIQAETQSAGRERAFELFGPRFCFEYFNEQFDLSTMHFFPRGLIAVEGL